MFNFNVVFLIVLFVYGVNCNGATDIQKKLVRAHVKNCMAQTGTTQDIMAKVMSGVIVEDPRFIKLVFCVDKLSGFINEVGDIDKEVLELKTIQAIGTREKSIAMAEKCAQQKSTPEESAYELYKCYLLDGFNLFEP
ncbi:unnamed protein product [Brassicogethes aeneus]|uniref:Uncharacterized protein n=1 Tax=Brassicogethes aeneus TaxID=1431903 RepID=A0A9P0AZR4_BRAAE|nr:unnamed protein product [Brassicogethes aeneus]